MCRFSSFQNVNLSINNFCVSAKISQNRSLREAEGGSYIGLYSIITQNNSQATLLRSSVLMLSG